MWRRVTLIFWLIFSTVAVSYAQQGDNAPLPTVIAEQDLQELSRDLDGFASDNRLKAITLDELAPEVEAALPADRVIQQEDLNDTRNALEKVQLAINNLGILLTDNSKQLGEAERNASQLLASQQRRANPLSGGQDADSKAAFDDLIARNNRHIALLEQQKKLLQESIQLNRYHLTLLEARYQRYNERYLEARDTIAKTIPLTSTQTQLLLQSERDRLVQTLARDNLPRDTRLTSNISIALIDKHLLFLQMTQDIGGLDTRLQDLQFADFSSVSLERIVRVQTELAQIQERLQSSLTLLESNFFTISEQFTLYGRQVSAIPADITRRHSNMNAAYHQLHSLLENNLLNLAVIRKNADAQYTLLSKHYLSEQYRFGGLARLPALALAVSKAPITFLGQYTVAGSTFADTLHKQSPNKLITLVIITLSLIVGTGFLTSHMNHLARRLNHDNKRPSFTRRLLLFIFGMLKYLLPYLGFLALSWIILSLLAIPAPSYGLLLLPAVALFFIALPYFSARILITSHLMESAGSHRIIRPVVIIASIGTLLFSMVMLAGWVLSEQTTIDAYRWIFCLYILLMSWPIFRLVRRTIAYLDEHLRESYIYRILRTIAYLICLGQFIFGLTGTLGYLNLAWAIARHQFILWAFVLIWVGILAVAKDLSLWAKRYALKNTNNGVFWAQDVINPIHALVHWGSLVLLAYLLFHLFGWTANSPIVRPLLDILHTPIFGGEDGQFTLMNILLMGLLIYIVFRIGGWARSLAYRWIFARIADLGIRNSFSVFTQYAIVTLGFLLALRVIGLDLTTFTIFAGALGVGIGFGLQTIANNFISGLLLLIERPLRNGDTISVGNYDGKVERIGMRSLTITTFNNESVILPNSDFVTSAFKNWSHSDQILRMVLYLDLNYRHSPQEVVNNLMIAMRGLVAEGLILDELPDFVPNVYAFNYSERGMTYRVQYFFHIDNQPMFSTKTRVIQTIWETCRAHGYEIAYPKQDVFFPDHPEGLIREHIPPGVHNPLSLDKP